VSVRKLIVVFEGIYSLPHSALILHVAEALLIYSYFAKIVKQGYDGNALIGIFKSEGGLDSGRFKIGNETFINVDGMLTKTTLV
jgi:hypothetical protein